MRENDKISSVFQDFIMLRLLLFQILLDIQNGVICRYDELQVTKIILTSFDKISIFLVFTTQSCSKNMANQL